MAETHGHRAGSNELMFRIGVGAIAALLAVGLIRLRFCYPVTLPALPPEPAAEDVSLDRVTDSVEASPTIYAGYLQKDAERHRLESPPTVETMAAVLPYQSDDTVRVLDPGDRDRKVIEAAGLRLSVSITNLKDTPRRMLVLTIENLTDRDVAYHVTTRPSRGIRSCAGKVHLLHNSMAIRARGKVMRSECLYKSGWTLEVRRIETVELPPLSYYYVSKVPPEVVGIPPRLGRGHQPPADSACNILLPATIRNALERGDLTWRDLIDFYARHRCETYRFPEGYRAFTADGERRLPVTPSP